jgi:hypothetical protein
MDLVKSTLIWVKWVKTTMHLQPKHGRPCTNCSFVGFVFVEANVKKWGLAPIQGTMAPPPAYGLEGGSILLASSSGNRDEVDSSHTPIRLPAETQFTASGSTSRAIHPPPYSSFTIDMDDES